MPEINSYLSLIYSRAHKNAQRPRLQGMECAFLPTTLQGMACGKTLQHRNYICKEARYFNALKEAEHGMHRSLSITKGRATVNLD